MAARRSRVKLDESDTAMTVTREAESAAVVDQRTRSLVQRFRRQRPLRGGSLIITIFGDSIAPRGGDVSLGSLIRLAAPFGLTERLVRTSVGRLAQDGWLESHRRGRLSFYRLSETGRARFADATLRIYGEAPPVWNGDWTLVVADAALGRQRERLREEMSWLGFGQILPGVLAHPAHDIDDTRARLNELGMLAHVTILRARIAAGDRPDRLVTAGWDLAQLARRYRGFLATFRPVAQAITTTDAPPSPGTSFVVRTLLIHEYRKIHLRDPLLPASLLPSDWVGGVAYSLCRETYSRVFAPAEVWLTQEAESTQGRLPAADRDALRRFGGMQTSG
jgi:phenylacetic acid degradation operon negative regulatory protein